MFTKRGSILSSQMSDIFEYRIKIISGMLDCCMESVLSNLFHKLSFCFLIGFLLVNSRFFLKHFILSNHFPVVVCLLLSLNQINNWCIIFYSISTFTSIASKFYDYLTGTYELEVSEINFINIIYRNYQLQISFQTEYLWILKNPFLNFP